MMQLGMKEDQVFLFADEMIINIRGPKETVFSHREKLNYDTCRKMDGTGNDYLK